MYAEERQHAIATRARTEGRVDVAALAEEFAVTTETVRRDLSALERQGLLKRVHGGAIPVERLGFEPGLAFRDETMVDEKERIAKAALAQVPDEGAVILDAGTTTSRLAEALPSDRELTVVTNGLPIALALSTRPHLTVVTLGGRIRGRTLAAVDAPALAMLRDLYVDVAFLGANGVSVERGLTTADPAEAATKRAMVQASRRRVLLADHTKVGAAQLSRFADVADLDVLVTDAGLDPALVAELEAAGPAVVRA
jgi:DeoR family transcriptional regulator, fructose operon transcriptional repressor